MSINTHSVVAVKIETNRIQYEGPNSISEYIDSDDTVMSLYYQ